MAKILLLAVGGRVSEAISPLGIFSFNVRSSKCKCRCVWLRFLSKYANLMNNLPNRIVSSKLAEIRKWWPEWQRSNTSHVSFFDPTDVSAVVRRGDRAPFGYMFGSTFGWGDEKGFCYNAWYQLAFFALRGFVCR